VQADSRVLEERGDGWLTPWCKADIRVLADSMVPAISRVLTASRVPADRRVLNSRLESNFRVLVCRRCSKTAGCWPTAVLLSANNTGVGQQKSAN